MVLALVVAALLAACGGSGASSAERTRLANEVAGQLGTARVPRDLASCITQQSRRLPLASLRKLARAGSNPSPSTKQLGEHLFVACIEQGKGVAAIHEQIVQSMLQSLPSTTPRAFTSCLADKANAIKPGELASLVFAASRGQSSAVQAQGRRLGFAFAEQCFETPAMRPVLLGLVLAPLQRELDNGHYSAAFKTCLVGKVRMIPSADLVHLALDPAGANASGVAFGRKAAEACIASGAKP